LDDSVRDIADRMDRRIHGLARSQRIDPFVACFCHHLADFAFRLGQANRIRLPAVHGNNTHPSPQQYRPSFSSPTQNGSHNSDEA
jgi:hypothetical protein